MRNARAATDTREHLARCNKHVVNTCDAICGNGAKHRKCGTNVETSDGEAGERKHEHGKHLNKVTSLNRQWRMSVVAPTFEADYVNVLSESV